MPEFAKYYVGNALVDSIPCLQRGNTKLASLAELVKACGGSTSTENDRLTLFLIKQQAVLRNGSSFVSMSDGSVVQLPLPVEKRITGWYIEAVAATALISQCGGLTATFDPVALHFRAASDIPAPSKKDEHKEWAFDLVVIDAGHGGKDPGAIGQSGLKEKDVTLDVALRLDKALKNKNIKTVLTRDSDKFIALSDRTTIANKSGGKLFISIHCNSAKQRKAEGMETYFLAPSKTERATQVALLENESIRFEERQDRYQELTEESYILMTMTQATFTQESQSLAGLVQEAVSRKAGLRNRGVDQAGFYVLIGASMPAILFEIAFISNKEEEKKLKDKKFRQKIADEMCAAIVQFLERQSKNGNFIGSSSK